MVCVQSYFLLILFSSNFQVDVVADCQSALDDAAKKTAPKDGENPKIPLNPEFSPPSSQSQCEVVFGKDGGAYDLVMTKVDVSYGQ